MEGGECRARELREGIWVGKELRARLISSGLCGCSAEPTASAASA